MSDETKRLISAVLDSLPAINASTVKWTVDELWAQVLRRRAAEKRAEFAAPAPAKAEGAA